MGQRIVPIAALCAVLFLSPLLAALPDDPSNAMPSSTAPGLLGPILSPLPGQQVWACLFVALAVGAALWLIVSDLVSKPAGVAYPHPVGIAALVAGIAVVSLLWKWAAIERFAPVYLDSMLRGASLWVVFASIVFVASRATGRAERFALILSLLAGCCVASAAGTQDYLMHLKNHETDAREFVTSTPDFYAGFLVMTIPLTLALYLGAASGPGYLMWLAYILCLLFELAVLPATGDRFSLFSVTTGLVVFGALVLMRRAENLQWPAASRIRVIVLAIVAVGGAVVFARPLLHRLEAGTLKAEAHSGDFRLFTWKGAAALARANPLLGSGPGTFAYAYPRYAVVGFTRLAHNSYIQTAGEIGIPAVCCVLALFGLCLYGGARRSLGPALECDEARAEAGSKTPSSSHLRTKRGSRASQQHGQVRAPSASDTFLSQFGVFDDRIVLAALVGALAAGVLQNAIDSDWFVFFDGVTLFALVGLIVSFQEGSQPDSAAPSVPLGRLLGVAAAALLAVTVALNLTWSSAAESAGSGDFASASADAPLNADYLSNLAWRTFLPAGNVSGAEEALRRSAALAPSSVTYYRLGRVLESQNDEAGAIASYTDGLKGCDPNSLELLLALAQAYQKSGQNEQAMDAYSRIARLEDEPYGKVRAIPEVI